LVLKTETVRTVR